MKTSKAKRATTPELYNYLKENRLIKQFIANTTAFRPGRLEAAITDSAPLYSIAMAFTWSRTKEGCLYWQKHSNIFDAIQKS